MGKIIFSILVVLLIVCAIFSLCSGCATRPVVISTDESVVSSQISVARLEEANGFSRELLQFATDENRLIRGALIEGRGGIEAALIALDEYDEFVQELISRIRQLEYLTRSGEGESENKKHDFVVGGNPFLD